MKKITAWKTTDSRLFETETEASFHQEHLDIVAAKEAQRLIEERDKKEFYIKALRIMYPIRLSTFSDDNLLLYFGKNSLPVDWKAEILRMVEVVERMYATKEELKKIFKQA